MASKLEKQSKQFAVVIRKNKPITKSKMIEFLSQYCSQWAYIEHKGDINPNGELEGIHYHLCMLLPKRKRVYTLLNDITTHFGFDNNNGIEVDILQSLEGLIQYFTHKNDKDKTPHKFEEIVSNIDKEELRTIYDTEDNSLTYDRLVYIITNAKSKLEVIKGVGFTRYNMYRNTIIDMWQCIKER